MDRSRSSTKRSDHTLKHLVEVAVADACNLQTRGFVFQVDEVQAVGRPPERLAVWATLRFLQCGSPFCCGEPDCQLDLRGARLERVQDSLRSAMGLRQAVVLEVGERVRPDYAPGVTFHYGHDD